MADKIHLDALNRADKPDFVTQLADIFENAPWVAAKALADRPFATVADLHDAMMRAVRDLPRNSLLEFVKGHPDLAGKAARAGSIAPASVAEQAGLGLDRLSDDEFARFEALDAAYRKRFDFPFVICVRRQTRDAVLDALERRLSNEPDKELKVAIDEIGHITRLRLVDRVEGMGKPVVAGRLSTHVLDTYQGRPAEGVVVELFEAGGSARACLVRTTTNRDGRTDDPLIANVPLRIGTYELVFHAGDYFKARGVSLPDRPFLDVVPLRFGISEPEGNYHIPLLVTPWSYATYRGS